MSEEGFRRRPSTAVGCGALGVSPPLLPGGWVGTEKTALRSCFPLRTAPLWRIVRRTQREDSLSLNCDTRRQQGSPGELFYLSLPNRACLLLRLSCFFCGRCRRYTVISSSENCFKVQDPLTPVSEKLGFRRKPNLSVLAARIFFDSSLFLVWLIELSFPRRVSAGVRAPLWGAGHWA